MAGMERNSHQLPVVREWDCTFYIEEDHVWQKGCLQLTHCCLSFLDYPSEKTCFAVDFESIAYVKVERAWSGYKTLVVFVGSKKFWFSSFSHSLGVRRIIQHFVREALLSYPAADRGRSMSDGTGTRSKLGRELLSVALDSQRTLTGAAAQLSSQGDQLEEALRTTSVIRRDMGIASQNIAHLESWLGRWHVGAEDLVQNPSPQPTIPISDDPQFFPVLFRSRAGAEESGTCTVSRENIIVHDEEKKEKAKFNFTDVSVINVRTPWTLVITRRRMGQPDIQCHVTSAKLLSLLRVLQARIGNKIEYDEPQDVSFVFSHVANQGPSQLQDGSEAHHSAGTHLSPHGEQSQQCVDEAESVTVQEADQLNHVLRDMKTLALGIGGELDVQDELISNLTDEVSNLTEDVSRNNRRMQRLL